MKALIYRLQEAGTRQWKKIEIYLEEPQKNVKYN